VAGLLRAADLSKPQPLTRPPLADDEGAKMSSTSASALQSSPLLDQIREHWARPQNYDVEWAVRTKIAAEIAKAAEWVCDIWMRSTSLPQGDPAAGHDLTAK
jgi:hypothetical protein